MAERVFSSHGLVHTKLKKYMRLTVGQLKCASDFTKRVTSARWKILHETHSASPHRQSLKSTTTHMNLHPYIIQFCKLLL